MFGRLFYRVSYVALAVLGWRARRFPSLGVPGCVPLAGRIDGLSFAPPLKIRGRFGRSMSVPAILRIDIDGPGSTTSPAALHPVATRLFPDRPKFTFNVAFACGRARPLRPGVYGDPRSPWFNVFAGYYELDVDRALWDRPFGYRRVDGKWEVDTDDVGRLGSADWNYFSNYMYGVPLDAIEPVDKPVATFGPPGSIEIAGRRWHHLTAEGMRAASAFLARGGPSLVDTVPVLTQIWRVVFGLPYRGDESPTIASSPPVCARRALHVLRGTARPLSNVSFSGGTANQWWEAQESSRAALNREFLVLQMHATRTLIERRFAHLGFD